MDLDDLKQSWEKQDEKLNESLKLNKYLLKQLKFDKTKKEFKSIQLLEILSVIICSVGIPLGIYKFITSDIFFIKGTCISLTVILAILLYAALKKLSLLKNLKQNNESVINFQKDLVQFEKSYLFFKKLDFILLPIAYIVGFIFGHFSHESHAKKAFEYNSEKTLIIVLVSFIAIGLCYVFTYYYYKYLYDKRIKNAKSILKELEEFQSNQ